MKAAAQMAQTNMNKESLAEELAKVSDEIKGLEKRKEWLKAKLDPLMSAGEKVGRVEKIESQGLAIDDELLSVLEKEFGSEIVRRELNTKLLREKMLGDPNLDARIPRSPAKTQLRVT